MLIIVVNHEHGFTGSRRFHAKEEPFKHDEDREILDYLHREFPNMFFDDILFIQNDIVIEEWVEGGAVCLVHSREE